MGRRRQRRNRYRYRAGQGRRLRVDRLILAIVCLIALVAGLWQLGSYIENLIRMRRQEAALRAEYYATDVPAATPGLSPAPTAEPTLANTPRPTPVQLSAWGYGSATDAPLPTDTPVPTPLPTVAAALPGQAAGPTAVPTASPDPYATLPPVPYPNNRYKTITTRFTRLQKQNKDIVGWLNVDGLLETAVVQRDNEYYLRRDYLGYHNENGAIFLEEGVSLDTRPYTLILYGHNMKTGAMFGSLRNLEDIGFYRKHPIVTFDSIYEDGRYVIFSVAEVSLKTSDRNYAGFYRLNDCTRMEREDIIDDLIRLSVHTCPVDVNAEDQLLLLVTCVDDDDERRVVAARRVRPDETETQLITLLQNAHKK